MRKVNVYQVVDEGDPANSDSWHPTLALARAYVREQYGIRGRLELDESGEWTGRLDEDSVQVSIQRHAIGLSTMGICSALQYLPAR